MVLTIGATVLGGLALLTTIVTYQTTRAARHDALTIARQEAANAGHIASKALERGMEAAETIAQAFEGLVEMEGKPSREMADAMLKRIVEENPDFLGIWCVWEPNAFDRSDAAYAGKPGHDATGRFVPYWHRSTGTLTREAVRDYATPGAGDFYLLPKANNRDWVIEPYLYTAGGRSVLMTSLVVPIHTTGNDTFVGAVGVDIDLAMLAKTVATLKVGHSGYVALVSNGGKYVAHPKPERNGKPLVESDPWAQPHLDEIKRGEAFMSESYSATLNDVSYRIAVPVQLGESTMPWAAIATAIRGEVLATATYTRNLVIAIGGAVLLGVLVVVWWLARVLARPIQRVAATLGDGSEQVASAAMQVASASQAMASGASEQASSLEETSAACEELSSMTKRNADHAVVARALASETRAAAEGGTKDMRELTVAMTDLKESSANVAKIVKTIDEIAFQTNLLALNAAVEAARAGDAGAGFAVVAEEVRRLAQRSAQAAKETASTIETTIATSERGYEISGRVAASLEGIVAKARGVDDVVGQIATASGEQTQGIGEINGALGQMDKTTQQAAAQAEETASASEELSAQASTMEEAVRELLAVVTGKAQPSSIRESDTRRPAAPMMSTNPVRQGYAQQPHVLRRSAQPLNMEAGA